MAKDSKDGHIKSFALDRLTNLEITNINYQYPDNYNIEQSYRYIGFSKRTLQRDIREIRKVFGIDIDYSKSAKGYYISQSETENMNFQRMIEAFDMFNSLNIAQDLAPFIHLEKRRP